METLRATLPWPRLSATPALLPLRWCWMARSREPEWCSPSLKGINLVEYGDPQGYTAMAKTVGYPCAIATKMVLDGEIQRTGMVLPFTQDIYKPMLTRLRDEGIVAT